MSENLLFLWRFSFSASHFVDDLKTTISTASSVSDVTEIIKFRMRARAIHHFSSRTASYEATSSMRKVPNIADVADVRLEVKEDGEGIYQQPVIKLSDVEKNRLCL